MVQLVYKVFKVMPERLEHMVCKEFKVKQDLQVYKEFKAQLD
jgi:hypothetical protein